MPGKGVENYFLKLNKGCDIYLNCETGAVI